MVREGSSEKVTFELNLLVREGVSHGRTREKAIREERTTAKTKKDPEAV